MGPFPDDFIHRPVKRPMAYLGKSKKKKKKKEGETGDFLHYFPSYLLNLVGPVFTISQWKPQRISISSAEQYIRWKHWNCLPVATRKSLRIATKGN